MNIRRVGPEYFKDYRRSLAGTDGAVAETVSRIIRDVRERGDEAVLEYTRKFDRVADPSFGLTVGAGEIEDAHRAVRREHAGIFSFFMNAAANIRAFHERQKDAGFSYTENGSLFGQAVRPLERAGIYVPGGKAFYPSTLLMNAIPAKIAGVGEICLASPPGPDGRLQPLLVALADSLGVDRMFKMGGAQAIGALAYGTRTVPAVNKITGPGNIYVAMAKLQVSGMVGIDSIAGPSEVVVLADDTAVPEWAAVDLCAQAEHDPDTTAIFISTSDGMLDAVDKALDRIVPGLPRKSIIEESLTRNSLFVKVNSPDEGFEIINRIAPEHVEVHLGMRPEEVIVKVRNAGMVFIGNHTPVAAGDYYAGTNHVLPTNGTASFSSPLGVYDFVKRTGYLSLAPQYLADKGSEIAALADFEGLQAHAESIRVRNDRKS